MRRRGGIAVPDGLANAPGRRLVRNLRREEVDRRFGLRDVDVAALAGPRAAVERREQDDQREPRRNVVAVGPYGPSGGRSGQPTSDWNPDIAPPMFPYPAKPPYGPVCPMSDVLSTITLVLSSCSRS